MPVYVKGLPMINYSAAVMVQGDHASAFERFTPCAPNTHLRSSQYWPEVLKIAHNMYLHRLGVSSRLFTSMLSSLCGISLES